MTSSAGRCLLSEARRAKKRPEEAMEICLSVCFVSVCERKVTDDWEATATGVLFVFVCSGVDVVWNGV